MARASLPVFLCLTAFAADPNSLKPQGYVNDFARVLDEQSRMQLEDYCGQVERATGAQMALVTIDSLDGRPIEDFANTLYRKWGIGRKGKDEGILLLLAIQDRKDRIEIGYGLEPVLPDGFVGSVLRQSRPFLRQGQYGQAMLAAAGEMGTRIAHAKGVSLDFSLPRAPSPAPETDFPWPLAVIGILVLLFLMRRGGGGGGFLTGMILGNVLGRSGRWGGGGFGGYDSGSGGGGFGGFGGGDSGGGGASSDW